MLFDDDPNALKELVISLITAAVYDDADAFEVLLSDRNADELLMLVVVLVGHIYEHMMAIAAHSNGDVLEMWQEAVLATRITPDA